MPCVCTDGAPWLDCHFAMPADPGKPTPTRCPNCASTDTSPVFETNYGQYWRCAECGHVWHQDTRPRPKGFPPFFEFRAGTLVELLENLFPPVFAPRRRECA